MIETVKINYGYALLEEVEDTQTHGKIVIPDIGKEKPMMGKIIKLKEIYNYHKGNIVDCIFNEGDIVYYPSMGGKTIKIENKNYVVVSIQDLLISI